MSLKGEGILGNSFFEDQFDMDEVTSGFQPIYHGDTQHGRREEKVESKEGRVILKGVDMSQKRIDRLSTYALLLGILSIFCVLLDNGYLISMIGLLLAARAFYSGTKRMKTTYAAVCCSVLAILLYIIAVAARPLLQDYIWYQKFVELVGAYWPL